MKFFLFLVSLNLVIPTVSPDVLRTASLRHQKGLMAPMILHVLSTQEVRLPCLMEDEGNREFHPIHDIYQPLRQKVYAVLFNLHHLRYVHTKKKGKVLSPLVITTLAGMIFVAYFGPLFLPFTFLIERILIKP